MKEKQIVLEKEKKWKPKDEKIKERRIMKNNEERGEKKKVKRKSGKNELNW